MHSRVASSILIYLPSSDQFLPIVNSQNQYRRVELKQKLLLRILLMSKDERFIVRGILCEMYANVMTKIYIQLYSIHYTNISTRFVLDMKVTTFYRSIFNIYLRRHNRRIDYIKKLHEVTTKYIFQET